MLSRSPLFGGMPVPEAVAARDLRHVAGDAFDDGLIAAAQLNHIAIRIADEDRNRGRR